MVMEHFVQVSFNGTFRGLEVPIWTELLLEGEEEVVDITDSEEQRSWSSKEEGRVKHLK